MAFVIGRPTGVDSIGEPDVPVVRIIAPVAIVVQILIADHIVREILRRTREVVTVVATFGPGIEFVGAVKRLDVGIERVRSAERAGLSAAQIVALARANGLALARADADHRVAAIGTRLHAIVTGLGDRERLVRRIDLKVIVLAQPAHRDVDRARRKLDLNRIVVEVQEGEASIGCQADHGRSQLHFGARVLIGPELVARSHRTVRNGSHPVAFAGGLKRNRTLQVTEAGHPAGRIILILILSG